MDCPACGHWNRDGARFCGQCSAPLAARRECPACGTGNPGGQRFCDACGAALGPAPAPAAIARGRYLLQRPLGESRRREVRLARDTRLDREVALSLVHTAGLDEVDVARARREARAMGRLGDHPHIVTVLDSGEENGRPWVASQYMSGGTLADELARSEDGRLSVERALEVGEEICRALEYAHRRGFVHRELGPASVWISGHGAAKLGDFTLAGAAERSERDPRANLRALGALLYELLAGRRPEQPPVPPSEHRAGIPAELEELVLGLLSPVPDHRPQNAAAVRETIAALRPRPAAGQAAGEAPDPLGGVFVGRERENALLRGALDEALGGTPRVVTLTGEPGIGKTRTADELSAHAGEHGAQVLWGRCYEGEGAPAYWPWVQVVRAYVWSRDPEAVAAVMGDGAADIAQLVSDVRERLPGLEPPPQVEPDQARFRLFDAVAGFVRGAAAEQPLVVILDDLHWADKPSLLLLEFLVHEAGSSRLLLLGTYRDGELSPRHPLRELVGELRAHGMLTEVPLGGLSPEDVRELLEATAGRELGPDTLELARLVDRETEGNPFFIQEVLRHLAESGGVEHGTVERLGLPEGVREVIGRRLGRLSPDCVAVLTAGAVIGRDFGLDPLERIVDLSVDELLEALEEALAAHVIAETADRPGRYSFSHALVRETIYGDLTATRRVRLHLRVGEALEDLYSESVERHLPELAYHFREAAPADTTDRAVDYAARAGAHASEQLAYEEAAGHFEHALEVLARAGPVDEPRRCDLLIALGEARGRAGLTAAARESFQSAAALARELGSADRLARAAIGFGAGPGGFGYTGRADEALINLLYEALATLPGGDDPMRVRLMSRLAVELYYTPDADRRAELGREAVAMARRLGAVDAQLGALCGRLWSSLGPDGLEERSEAAGEVLRLAEASGDREMAFRGHHFRLATALELGDMDEADREIAAAQALADELRQPVYRWQATSFAAMRALFEGKLGEGERIGEEAFAIGRRGHSDIAGVQFGVQLILMRFLQGRMGELQEALTGFVRAYPESSFRPALAMAYTESGRESDAREELALLARDDFGGLHRDGNWLASVATLCMVVRALRDARRAALLAELLTPYADRLVVGLAGAVCMGPVAHYLGLAEATAGSEERAARRFEQTIEFAERRGGRCNVVWARYEYGAMLLARDGDGDAARGGALLTECLAEARELGMGRFTERILAREAARAG